MIFKPKFFLDLSGGKEPEQNKAAVVAPPKPAVEKKKPAAEPPKDKKAEPPAPTEAAVETLVSEIPPAAPTLTTAEAIAAELAAAQASRPAPTLATFAPTCLTPGGANPRLRRTGGANLSRFKDMAKGMTRN
jgi:hypothetical protein